MLDISKKAAEKILIELDEAEYLFPQFRLKKSNNEVQLLGQGGFSSVYEMYNKERPERTYALKVIGFQNHTVTSAAFRSTNRIQWILSKESKYIVRILGSRELLVDLDDDGNVAGVKDASKESWEEETNHFHLQLVLMERLSNLIEKDRFGNIHLLREELKSKEEVRKLALEIGQALLVAHTNCCLHRDIKLENIFWDRTEQVYKLGDFGIAKYSEDGNAETIVYTDGYGAPEIERRLFDSYNTTADIYSFGITLYLLLNDLKFPGSDGYYPKTEVQYNPEFIFPAPIHATEELTRIIRKACSYYVEHRYQSMAEVLQDLIGAFENENKEETSDELYKLMDLVTETFREEKINEDKEEKPMTRAVRKELQKQTDTLYRKYSLCFFMALTILMTLLFHGMYTDAALANNWLFIILPVMVCLEAALQSVGEFHLFFGIFTIAFCFFSIYSLGITWPHVIMCVCVVIGCPVLTLSGAVATGLWILTESLPQLSFMDILWKWDLGWVFLALVLLVMNRYFQMRNNFGKNTYARTSLCNYLYDRLTPVGTGLGLVIWILGKLGVLSIPILIEKMHLVRTGMVLLLGLMFFYERDGYFDEDNDGELEIDKNGEFMDQ